MGVDFLIGGTVDVKNYRTVKRHRPKARSGSPLRLPLLIGLSPTPNLCDLLADNVAACCGLPFLYTRQQVTIHTASRPRTICERILMMAAKVSLSLASSKVSNAKDEKVVNPPIIPIKMKRRTSEVNIDRVSASAARKPITRQPRALITERKPGVIEKLVNQGAEQISTHPADKTTSSNENYS